MKEKETAALPSETRAFLGLGGESRGYNGSARPPSFGQIEDDAPFPTPSPETPPQTDLDSFDERTRKERKARAQASVHMLFGTDVSKLDDAGASALYQSVTEGIFGLPDEDGSVAFGKRAAKDPRQNIDMLRRFVKGEYTLIEDPEYTKWREMDEEAKFRHALEHETTGNMVKSKLKGERGTSPLTVMAAGDMSSFAMPWNDEQRTGQDKDGKWRKNAIRNSSYETMDEDEKATYRKDVIADYDEKLSRRQTLATFLQFSQGLSDRAGHLLAKSFADGTPDSNIETLPEDERDRVYSAFSLMRGDQKSGTLLFVPTDFTDDTVLNRVQLGLYGLQQSVIGLATDTWDYARNLGMVGVAKAGYDISRMSPTDIALFRWKKAKMTNAERADMFKGFDAQARAEQAMKQELPDAQGFVGEAFQGVMENLHWFIPYGAIGKGGKMVSAARGVKGEQGILKGLATTLRPMKLGGTLKEEKAALEAGKAAMEAGAAATRAAWTLDVNGVKKLGEMGNAILARQMAAVERYTQMLHGIENDLKAAKWWKDAAGTGMWMAGEAQAFSAFASEYISNADAAGISREESVLTAAAIGLINAKIEQLYVPGLESSLSPAQIKSLTFAAMVQAIRSDGAAGFRKWLANRVGYGVKEGVKVAATEGLVEEPLQQMAIEHGKAFDKLCQELRKNGQAMLANEAKALWTSFAETLPKDYATFIDTAVDMLPSSVGFGVTTVGNMTRRQHIHNVMTRHANRRAGAKETDTMLSLGQRGEDPSKAFDYDAGLVDVIQQAVNVRTAVEKHWQGEEDGGDARNPHRFEEAITAARRAWRDPQTRDAVQEIADAAGVDVKTAEVLAQYLQTEAEAAAFSPQARAWTALNMSLADIDEATIKTVLPGYVEGSFASDPENGIYSGRVRMDDGTEKTIAYRVGDWSEIAGEYVEEQIKDGSNLGKSFDARQAEAGNGTRWADLTPETRRAVAISAANGLSTGKSGIFELTDAKGEKVRVNADDIILLANGRLADIGYGAAATQATVRHETFHSLWRFVRGTLADADVQQLAKTLGIDVTADNWERKLDERMAHEMERYASGHYVSHAVSSRFDKMLDSWAGKIIKFFGQFGPSDEVTDPKTGKPYQLKGLYDRILRGELGSGTLGVELRKVPQQTAEPTATPKSSMPVEVTDADRAEAEAEAQAEIKEEEPSPAPASPAPTVTPAPTAAPVQAATAEHPADAATPNQRFYEVGLPNSPVKLVGRLEVRDVDTGIITSTDADYHDRGNQNRDDKSEESRALVEKIGANPDPLQIGTVQPIASNGIIWILPNGDVIIGNHRVNGVRLGYAKGTTAELEKFVREDAAKRGIEIGADVKKPLMVFVLERIDSPDGKADVHEVVRLANESQNRGFNIREQAGNDAKILIDNNLLPRMVFRADGRIDETKSGDAIGKFRQETGAQGMIAEDGSLTEEGQTRIQNAALAALLGGEGNNALLQKIMSNAGRLDMQNEVRALMKMTPELMALAEAKPGYDLRGPLAEALQLFTEWRDKDETARVEKGKTRHDWRETAKDGTRKRGLSWEAFMSQGDMFRAPSEEAKILGDLLARAEAERSFDREDVESAVGKKRAIDLISDYLTDYIKNARAVNTETEDMFGGTPATRAEVMAAQRAAGEGGARFSLSPQAQLEYDEVVARYTNEDGTKKRGWMKAPNGKPTRLNESQWVMVRTPTFKKWFGDWEKAEITKRWFDIEASGILDGIATVDISSVQPLANKDAIAEAFVDFGIVTNGRDGRKVRFPGNTAGKMVYQRKYVAAYKKLFESAIRCWSEKENPVEGHKDHTSNIENYHHYVNKFKSAEGEFFVHFTVRESKTSTETDKNLVHAAEVSDVFVYNASANLAGSQTGSLGAGSTGRKPHADRKISYFLSGVNPGNEDCSKIVDANGEPLVVYRGAAFDPLAQETGKGVVMPEAYFTGDQEYAKRYGNVRAYYLDIRRPFDIRDPKCLTDLKKAYPDHEFQTGKSGALDWGEASVVDGEFLKDNFGDKYDGIVYDEGGDPAENEQGYTLRGVSYVPLDGGAQVKSATDNNGEFSGNPDVRYSIAVRLDEERQGLEAKGGKLLLAHHGTDSAGFTVFEKADDMGYFFAKSRSTAGSYIRNGQRADVNKKALPSYDELLKQKEQEGWIERGYALEDADGKLTGEFGGRWDRPFADRETAEAFAVGRKVVEVLSYNDELYRADKGIPYSALLDDGEKRSGVYDVALRMENPYIIDCKGANWDSIIDWDDAESRPDTVVYDKISVEPEDGHIFIAMREHGQEETNYESFATLDDAAKWAEANLGEEIADDIRNAAERDPFFEDDGRSLDVVSDRYPYAFDTGNVVGWYLEPKKTRDIVAEAFEDPDCDGVIFKNVVDNGGGVVDADADDVYVVRESKQAKLVDDMTYADDGSIIPAEERLNWSKQDIRYSVSRDLVEAMEQRERKALEPRAPQGESPYFTEADGAVEMPIRALRTVKDEPQRSIENARKHMEDAAAGRMPKRAPVSVVDNGDGTYTVIDGNATTWAAARGGLESVRANVVGKNRGTPLANSHYLVNEDKSGCDADGKLHTHGLERLIGEAAREKAYEQAGENAPLLKAVVDGAAKAVGCEAKSRKTLKKRQRVDEKAASYGGDYSRVVDLIGGTLILDPSQDMTTALKELRKNLPSGASIAQVKKLSSPDAGGYWDVKVSVRFKNGGIGEVILVDRNILDAKDNRGGHALYDYQRAIEEAEGTGEDAAELFFALKQIELAIYSHNTPRAAQHQATWDAAKASASASLTRFLESHGRDFISSMDMGTLKDLLEGSHLHQPASLDSYATPARSFIQNDISDSSLVSGTTRKILPNSGLTVNGENDNSGKKFSVEAPRLAYPSLLNTLSDEELLSAAVASRIALGKSDKVSDRSVKVSTVQKLVRRLHPDWDTTKVGVEAQRVMTGAQKFARRIREDLDRGVSESLVLEHLPDAMRSTFGAEMRQEARQGARLGAFGARANAEIGERQARIIEDAVRVQTGLDSGAIENVYGINLSETIMHLAENPLTEKDATQGATGEGEGSADEEGSATAGESEEATVEIDAKVKAVVDDIVSASGRQTGVDEQNRKNRKAAAGRDAENEAAMGEGEEALEAEGDSSGEGTEGDALAEAVKKSALNLENPRHLARFVAELARRQWIKEHGLAKDADVWRDLVAVQFLRKTAQSVYAKLCRDLTYSRSRETAMRGIAKLDSVPTVQGLISEMEFLGALINAQRIRDTQKQMCEKLDLFLRENFSAQGRFKPDKEEGKRKVSAEAELRARYMRECMWFSPGKAAEEAQKLQETLDVLSVDFADAGRDRDQSREFVETIRKLNVLREFGALRYKPVGEIEAAVQWWQDFARGESDDIVREMSDRDIRTKKAAHLLAVAFADPKRTTIREGGKADALNRFITGHMGFISLLQDCMRHASDADAAAVKDIVDYIAREVQKAGDRSEAEKRRHNDAFHSAVEGIYGKSFNAVMKDMMAPDERFTQYMGVVGGKRVTPTKGRALQLLVSLLQEGRKVQVEDEENPGQTKTVWEGGYHDNIVKHHREGQAAEIMRLLDPADMNMLKWLGQWYENNRSDLSGVCHSLFGIGVYAELPNYFPVKMMLETQGLEKGQGVGWTIFPKALTPRVRNERDFDTSADIFSMWASRMEEAAQWKHHAQLGLEMRGIFGRSELRETVRANHGASVDDLMQGFITDILAGHGAYDRSTAGVQYFSDQIRGWTALCALGGNIGVMAKQTTSIPAFGFEIGLVNTAKYMVSAFTPEGMAAMGKIWDSEQRRTRWNLGSSEAVRNALSQQNAGWLKRALQKSMVTTKLGDVVPALVVGQGIYRDCLDRGMSEDDAMAETWSIIERTQQSGRMENQTSIQRRNKLGRIMFQFLSTQQQYLQYEVRAIREVIARPDSVKRWGSLGRAILLNHFILSSAYYWMGQLYKYALGQEPPEDELKDWVITCLLGPYGSLFVAGFCCKYTLERAIKGYSIKGGSSMLPMESWLKNQVNDGAKLLEAIFDSDGDTWDNMLDAAGRWMSDSNSVVRDLRKIYRYRVKDEPQKK